MTTLWASSIGSILPSPAALARISPNPFAERALWKLPANRQEPEIPAWSRTAASKRALCRVRCAHGRGTRRLRHLRAYSGKATAGGEPDFGAGGPGVPVDNCTAVETRRNALTAGCVVAAAGVLVATSSAKRAVGKTLEIDEDPVAARIRKEIGGVEPMRSLGQSWAPQQLLPNKRGLQIFYPPWMAGRWGVRSKYLGALLPLGQRFVGPSVPGARKGSIVLAADIGFDPAEEFEQRFYPSAVEGGVVADRAFNVPAVFRAFWPEVDVTRCEYDPEKNTTRLSLDYTTPSRKTKVQGLGGAAIDEPPRVKRAMEVFVNNRESGYENENAFLCSELYRQSALEQARSYDYKTNLALQRISDDEVLAKYTIGAFLNPQDQLFFEAGDKAVVVYAYSLRYRRLSRVSA